MNFGGQKVKSKCAAVAVDVLLAAGGWMTAAADEWMNWAGCCRCRRPPRDDDDKKTVFWEFEGGLDFRLFPLLLLKHSLLSLSCARPLKNNNTP